MYTPLVSIVIPIYNRENTLNYCIESILGQEYENWELLLIDDGSTDLSAEICQSYCERDRRINYYYQTNQGAGPARNKGIDESKGDWITFVDSDDAIMPNHLAQIQKYGKGLDCVMVNRCHARYENGKLVKIKDEIKGIQDIRLSGNKEIINYLYGHFDPYSHANYACWDKFFKTSILREKCVRYPLDVPTGQDQIFVINYYKYTNEFYFSKEGTYVPTPMGNEGIDHLACKLRKPEEFFHCQMENYQALLSLSQATNSELVRNYAVNYILEKPFTRIIIPYTHWRNRRILGKKQILDFIQERFLPIIKDCEKDLHLVKNLLYREQIRAIIAGKSSNVYDYWFWKNLKNDVFFAVRRRIKKYC